MDPLLEGLHAQASRRLRPLRPPVPEQRRVEVRWPHDAPERPRPSEAVAEPVDDQAARWLLSEPRDLGDYAELGDAIEGPSAIRVDGALEPFTARRSTVVELVGEDPVVTALVGRTLFEQVAVELDPSRTLVLLITDIRAPTTGAPIPPESTRRLDEEVRATRDHQATEAWLDGIAETLELPVDDQEVDVDLFDRWAETEGLALALLRAEDTELLRSWEAWRADPGLRLLAADRVRRVVVRSASRR